MDTGGHTPVVRVTDVSTMRGLACGGVGAAILPVPLAANTELAPLEARLPGFDTDLWCLCHRDARESERIRAFMAEAATLGARIAETHGAKVRRDQTDKGRSGGPHARDH